MTPLQQAVYDRLRAEGPLPTTQAYPPGANRRARARSILLSLEARGFVRHVLRKCPRYNGTTWTQTVAFWEACRLPEHPGPGLSRSRGYSKETT
jgi:hypothetical protein